MKQKIKQLQSLLLLLILTVVGTASAWAAESATNNPATVSYGTGAAAKTFLDVANTVSNATIKEGNVKCVTYGLYEMDKNWKPAFYTGPNNGSSSSYSYTNAADYGFMAGSSAGTGTAANKSATSGYGAAKYHSGATAVIYVTGITGIAVMGKDNDTKSDKRLYIQVEEYASDGTLTTVGTTMSSYNKNLHITPFDAGTLVGSKYYKVTLTSGNTQNCETSQIRFTKYSSTTYTVTYDGNGNTSGSVPTDATAYAYNAEVTVKGNTGSLAKTGYTFNGWNTEDDGTGEDYSAGDKFNITGNTTLYAKWAAENYTVTIDANEGTGGSSSVTATYGSALPSFTAPTRDGYTLTGYWTAASGGDKVINANGSLVDNVDDYTVNGAWIYDGDKTLYAQWQKKTADKFHFVAKTSSSANSVDATTEKQIVTSTSPTSGQVNLATTLDGGSLYYKTKESRDCKSGILFATHSGAYDYLRVVLNSALQNGDVITCSISGSTGRCLAFTTSTTWSNSYITSGDTYTVTDGDDLAGKTEFYVWRGYATSTRLTELTITGSGSVTTYSVTYNGNDESTGEVPVDASSYVAGTSVTVLGNTGSLTKDNYTFAGWNTAANGSGTKYAPGATFSITSNTTLYAVWKHQVDLNVNNASMGSISAKYATADSYYGKAIGDAFTSGGLVSHDVQLTLNATPNTGYHFAGSWGSGTGATSNPATVPVGDNKNYIANFAPDTYTVTLDRNGGSADGSATATYNSGTLTDYSAATHATNTLTGYWTATSGGTKVINADGTLVANVAGYTTADGKWINTSDDVTLHAQWIAAVTLYTVTFSGNDHGTPASGSIQTTQGGSIILPACTASTYYQFVGWSKSDAAAEATYAAGASYTPEANETLYAVYKWQLLSQVSPAGAGNVEMRYTDEHGDVIPSGSYISKDATIWVEATANTGYTFSTWSNGSTSTDPTLTFSESAYPSVSAKTMIANFEPSTSTITIDRNEENGGAADGSAKATYNSSSLSNVVAPTAASGKSLVGTYTAKEGGVMVIDGGAKLVPNRAGYTDADGKWINTDDKVTLYAQWRDADAFSTALPYTYDFTDATWVTVGTKYPSGGSEPQQVTAKDGSGGHVIYFRGNAEEIEVVSGQHLQVNSNGSTNHFIAIPVSGINGRLDVTVEAPYTSGFKVRAYLDTSNGTTVQTNSPGSLGAKAMDYTATNTFVYREKDLTATSGVLYIGVNSSSYKLIDKITVSTPTNYLVPTPASVTMGDGETATVTIKNHSAQYKPVMKTDGGAFPSYLDEKATTFNPSTGELVIVAKAIGKDETIKFALDTNGDGIAEDVDLSIPVTVQGVTINSSPTSAVYAYGASATALSVGATQNDGGTLNYQWYRNTINSTTGGTAISGATYASYTPSTTLAAEDASFYYCVVSSSKSTSLPKTSGVAYVLTSSTGRYFHMSNVAGNRQTSEDSEAITGEVIAGGSATAIHNSGESFYRYIQRPSDKPHMYVVDQDNDYITVTLGKNIADGDKLSVRLMGYLGTAAGLVISDGTNSINIDQTDDTEKDYTNIDISAFAGKSTLYIKGKRTGTSNFFTNLIIFTPAALSVTNPTPSAQTIQSGETPAAMSVTASNGTTPYVYQWYQDSSESGSFNTTATGEGATTATFTPAALTETTYYKCKVTDNNGSGNTVWSGVASVTVTSLTHGWYTPASYTNNKATYLLTKTNYEDTGTGGNSAALSPTTHYWTESTKTSFTEKTIDGTKATYMRIASGKDYKTSTFYVKGPSAFTFRAGNGTERYYHITVDGVDYGQFEADPTVETRSFVLNPTGSVITFDQPTTEIILARLTFYKDQPANVVFKKDGEAVTEVTQYVADGPVDYAVESDCTGEFGTPSSSDPSIATASYSNGVLTVTPAIPAKEGRVVITLHQNGDADHAEADATLIVNMKKLEVTMSFSYDKVVLKESEVSANTAIAALKLPTLTITHADGPAYDATVKWDCDEKGLVTVAGAGSTNFTATYRTGQGGARIYAYVDETDHYSAAMAYFDLVVERGFSNNLPNGQSIKVQQQYTLEDNSGNAAVVLTYGGYKYLSDADKAKKWTKSAAKGSYFIDGYKYYTRNENDALNEYDNQLKGMKDDPTDNSCPDGLWYTTDEVKPNGKNYGEYERIRPFALPCKGGYLKFEPKQSGILTAYVWQNGVIGRGSGKANQIGSKPRLGYWFDQDGWVQHPVVDPVSKQPISNGNGRNTHVYNEENLDQQMTSQWLAKNDDAAIIPMLRSRYTNSEDPDINSSYSDTNIGYENPYWWPENADVIDNNKQMIPRKMKPVPYHNGFMVPEESYVKYTINVVAGKTYYFYGMMTKVGYVGMNFVPDESVLTTGGNDIAHRTEPLHLQTNDDMTIYKIGGSVLEKNTVVDEVTLPSNYRAEKWNTICLPFALSEDQVKEAFGEGTELAIFNGLRHDAANHIYYVRYLRHVDQNILPGQPYLIYPTGVDASGNPLATVGDVIGATVDGQGSTPRLTFNHVFIDKSKLKQDYTSYGSDKDADGNVSYVFTGTYAQSEIGKYDLYNRPKVGDLVRYMPENPSTVMTLNTYHAFIDVYSATMMQDGITFDFEAESSWDPSEGGEPTKVIMIGDDGVKEMNRVANGKTFNLMGQEVDPTSAKGIILVDGKKVMY